MLKKLLGFIIICLGGLILAQKPILNEQVNRQTIDIPKPVAWLRKLDDEVAYWLR